MRARVKRIRFFLLHFLAAMDDVERLICNADQKCGRLNQEIAQHKDHTLRQAKICSNTPLNT